MGPIFGAEIGLLLENELTATVFSAEFAETLAAEAAKAGRVANVHIKIDTGMNRLGFRPSENLFREISAIRKLPQLNIQGIYSHLAASENENDDEFTKRQFETFDEFTRGLEIPIRHISNSGGVLRHPGLHLDLVRIGVLAYGLAPCSTPEGAAELAKLGIKPALSLKSRVGHIKTVPKGESVGYGRNFYADDDMEIATIPLGYGDGIIRALSNRGKVLINGHLCPIVGNICMDQLMANASGAQAAAGDEVVLIGEQGQRAINAENIAIWLGSINYEVTTAISHRVERKYKN
jgi:alanine racemase